MRNVKEIAPHTMLISSKRNDNQKYNFQELIQRGLALKSNLTFEFRKTDTGLFNIMIFDPLGTVWYDGTDISKAIDNCVKRMLFLKAMTRQNTVQDTDDKTLIMNGISTSSNSRNISLIKRFQFLMNRTSSTL